MNRLIKNFLTTTLLCLWASTGFTHTDVMQTTPENGAVIDTKPEVIVINFASEIRLARVQLVDEQGDARKLSLKGQKTFLTKFEFPFDGEGLGKFTVNWRGIGADGHVLNGSFDFTIAAK